MNEERGQSNQEQILKIKDEVLERFRQLPAEHQALMTLVLVSKVMEGEWASWLQGAVETQRTLKIDPQVRLFPLTSISREDLKRLHFTETEIAQLTDEDMMKIARTMEDHYVYDMFWDELKFNAEQILEDRRLS